MSESARAVVSAFLEREFIRQVEFLAELVHVPSDNPPGDCATPAERAHELLENLLGLEVETDVVPDAVVKANGMISATNLIVRRRFGQGGGPTIALNAHGDVVPPGRGWSRDPYGAEIIDDPDHGLVMFGRGVAVSKSDFATYTWALLALIELEKQGVPLQGAVELHFTYDEEIGGTIGPQRLLEQRLSKPDFAICAGFSYGITSAHNGCLHLEVVVNGKSGHAAIPSTGVDALEAATHILNALYAHRAELSLMHSQVPGISTPTLNVGLIQGGINTNVVPDRVTLRLDRRIIPEESPTEAEEKLRALIERAGCGPSRHHARDQSHLDGGAAARVARRCADDRCVTQACGEGVRHADQCARCAALHRCAPLLDCGHSNRALRRRASHAARGEWARGG